MQTASCILVCIFIIVAIVIGAILIWRYMYKQRDMSSMRTKGGVFDSVELSRSEYYSAQNPYPDEDEEEDWIERIIPPERIYHSEPVDHPEFMTTIERISRPEFMDMCRSDPGFFRLVINFIATLPINEDDDDLDARIDIWRTFLHNKEVIRRIITDESYRITIPDEYNDRHHPLFTFYVQYHLLIGLCHNVGFYRTYDYLQRCALDDDHMAYYCISILCNGLRCMNATDAINFIDSALNGDHENINMAAPHYVILLCGLCMTKCSIIGRMDDSVYACLRRIYNEININDINENNVYALSTFVITLIKMLHYAETNEVTTSINNMLITIRENCTSAHVDASNIVRYINNYFSRRQ